jgi:putative aldouronate transport system permease protein
VKVQYLKRNKRFNLFDGMNYFVLTIIGLISIFPIWYVFVISISTGTSYINDKLHFWPKAFSLAEYYRAIFSGGIIGSLKISLFITAVGTILAILLTIPCSYALSKSRLRGRNVILIILMVTLFFTVPLIPKYLLVVKLGLKNNLFALILPMASSAYYIIISKTYMLGLPESLEESAKIDGCTDMGVLIKIIFPISMPMVATIGLFYGVQYYNDYFNALLFISSKSLYPLQYLLREMVINNLANNTSVGGDSTLSTEVFKMAAVIVGMVPVLIAYPFLQKYFVSGVTLGAVKE